MRANNNLYVAAIIATNFVSSLLVIFTNKWIYIHLGFPNLWLTFIHFVITYIGILICRSLSIFNVKYVPIKEILLICFSFCGFVVLTNFSLQNNTVGTYQLLKILTTPTIIFIQHVLYHKYFSTKVKFTLVPIIIGIFINSYYDLKFNAVGLFYGLSGVIVTSFFQIWAGEKQKEFQVNSLQLLYYLSPISCLVLSGLILLSNPIDSYNKIISQQNYWITFMMVTLSGVFALVINISSYSLIKCTSPLTYNMIGHLKFCSTILCAYILFNDPLLNYQFFGICLTMFGVFTYSYLKFVEQNRKIMPFYNGNTTTKL